MSSTRVSGRLAKKRHTGSSGYRRHADDFEYTPLVSQHKPSGAHNQQSGAHNQQSGAHNQQSRAQNQQSGAHNSPVRIVEPLNPSVTVTSGEVKVDVTPTSHAEAGRKRKRGRPPRIPKEEPDIQPAKPSSEASITQQSPVIEEYSPVEEDEGIDQPPESPSSVDMSQDIGSFNESSADNIIPSSADTSHDVIVESLGSVDAQSVGQKDIDEALMLDLKSGLENVIDCAEKSDTHKFDSSQVFPLVVGLLQPNLLLGIPGVVKETLNMVAMETGVCWEDYQSEAKIVYGSLEEMTDASHILHKLIEQTALTAEAPVEQTPVPDITADLPPQVEMILEPTTAQESSELESLIPCVDVPTDGTQTVAPPGGAETKQAEPPLGGIVKGEEGTAAEEKVKAEYVTGSVEDAGVGREIVPDYKKLKRQHTCMHKVADCAQCVAHCDLCSYRSSEVGLRKHKQRVHPTTTIDCEVCGMGFGIRYDMRRHRMIHFDSCGRLTEDGLRLYRGRPGVTDGETVTLGDLEVNFSNRERDEKPAQPIIKQEQDSDDQSHQAASSPDDVDTDRSTHVQCAFCTLTCALSRLTAHHQVAHTAVTDGAWLLCPACQGPEEDMDGLRRHWDECDKKDGELDEESVILMCRLCKALGNKKCIENHLTNHSTLIKCLHCSFKTARVSLAKSHMIKQHDIKFPRKQRVQKPRKTISKPPKETSILYKCGICDNIYKARSALHAHFRSHEDRPIIDCDQCDFRTDLRGKMTAHKQQVHREAGSLQCALCEKTYSSRATLDFHRESVHGVGQKLQACHLCDKVFTTKRFLQVHIKRSHVKVKKYFCPTCGKGFFERSRMKLHHQTHLPDSERLRKHVCSYCGKAFDTKSTLRQHENIHRGLKPYKCKVCEKSFEYSSELSKHMASHDARRPHVCSFCGKGFKFRYKLTAHTVTHTKNGRFYCEMCGKVYTARATLRKHICKAKVMDDVMVMKQRAELRARMPLGTAEIISFPGVKHEQMDLLAGAEVIEISTPSGDDQIPSDVIAIVNEATEKPDQGILYLCSICNQLFQDQEAVNTHMKDEHGAEAVIGQDHEPIMEEEAESKMEDYSVVSEAQTVDFLATDDLHQVVSVVVADSEQMVIDV